MPSRMIPFAVTIPQAQRDPELVEKLKAEWPGILAWMVDGCILWRERGLEPPSAVRNATEAYLEAEDSFSAWFEEKCEQNPKGWETSIDLSHHGKRGLNSRESSLATKNDLLSRSN